MAGIIKALNATGRCCVLRNTVGAVRSGPRWIVYGLGKGSTDLVGVLKNGRVFCLEVKKPNRKVDKAHEARQEEWRMRVKKYGGFATVVTSIEEALEALARAEKGGSE